jgi:hypothetical protein
MAGGGARCKQCLERIWAGGSPAIFECERRNRTGRAVPLDTPEAMVRPGPATAADQQPRPPRPSPSRPSRVGGELDDISVMGAEPE